MHVIVFLVVKTYEHNDNNKTRKTMMCAHCRLPGCEDLWAQEEEDQEDLWG